MPTARGRRPASTRLDSDTLFRGQGRGPLALEESFRDPLQDPAHIIPRPGGRRDCNQSSRAACRSIRAPWASGWRAGDAALSAQRRVPDGVRPRVTREVRSGCVAVSLAECLVLWFCVSLLCDRHRPSSVHPYRVGVPVVGRTVFRLPINQSIPTLNFLRLRRAITWIRCFRIQLSHAFIRLSPEKMLEVLIYAHI